MKIVILSGALIDRCSARGARFSVPPTASAADSDGNPGFSAAVRSPLAPQLTRLFGKRSLTFAARLRGERHSGDRNPGYSQFGVFGAESAAEAADGTLKRAPQGASEIPAPERRDTRAPRLSAMRPRAGVTLLEMLVVMVVIGLMAAISFPAASAGIDSIRINSASQSTAAFLNAALTRVERRQEPVELVISPGANTIRTYSNDPNSARQLTMPEGVSIESVLPNEPGAESAERRIILLPGGTAPGIGIQIANRRGARRIIRLDPATGFPRVESVISK